MPVSCSTEEQIVELSNGCICCTIRGDLANPLTDIGWRFSRNGIKSFDKVIVETTGLADPSPILNTLISADFCTSQTVRELAADGKAIYCG